MFGNACTLIARLKLDLQAMQYNVIMLTERISKWRRYLRNLQAKHARMAMEGASRAQAEAHALQGAQLALQASLIELDARKKSSQMYAAVYGKS